MESHRTQSNHAPRKKPGHRRLIWGLVIAVAVVLVAVVFAVPAWLSSDSGRRLILSRINDSVDGRVDMRTLSVGWFKGIHATDVTYQDGEGDTSVQVEQVTMHPKLASLLRGDLALGRTVLASPRVTLNVRQPTTEQWNKSTPPAKSSRQGVDLPLSALDLKVIDGNATVNLASNGRVQTVEFRNIASNVDLNPRGSKSTFDVSLAVAEKNGAESQVSAAGSLTRPEKKWTLKGTTGEFRVDINNLDLATLTPLFALMGRDITAAGQLNAEADIQIDQGRFERVVAQASLRDFSQTVAGKKTVLEEPVTIDIDIASAEDVTRIRQFDITSSFFTVRCKGTGQTVDYDARADLGKLQEVTRQFTDYGGYGFEGDAASKGSLTLGKDAITVAGQGLAENLVISKGDISAPATSANTGFNVQKTPDLLKIPSLKVMADVGHLELQDSVVTLGGEKAETRLNLSADVDLRKLQPFMRLVTGIPEDITVAGRLTSETAVTGRDGQMHVTTDKTNITNLVITSPDKEPFKQDTVNIAADVIADTRQKELTINDLLIESAQGESLIKVLKGRFNKNEKDGRTSVEGQLHARYDLAAVTAMASPFLPRGLTMQGVRTTELTFNSQYPTGAGQFLANLSGTTDLGFEKANYLGLNVGPADVQLRANEGLMTIDLPPTPVNDGRTQFAGSVNFRDTPMVLHMAQPTQLVENVNINDEMSRRLLAYVNPLFANQTEVTGVANFYCEELTLPFGEHLQKNMRMAGTVQLDDVRLKPQGLLGKIGVTTPVILTVQPTRFVVQDGVVSYPDMEARIGEYAVNFSGQVGLDRRIAMNMTLPLALTGRAVKVGQDPLARIILPIGGTLDEPTIDLNKAIENLGRQILEEELERRRQELRERLPKIFR